MSWNEFASMHNEANEPTDNDRSDYSMDDVGAESYTAEQQQTNNSSAYEEDGDYVKVPKSDLKKFQETVKHKEALARKLDNAKKLDTVLEKALVDVGESRTKAKSKKTETEKPVITEEQIMQMVDKRVNDTINPIVYNQILPSFEPAYEYAIEKATNEFKSKYKNFMTGDAETDNDIMNVVYNVTAERIPQNHKVTGKDLEQSFLIAFGDKLLGRLSEYEAKEAKRRKMYDTEESSNSGKTINIINSKADADKAFHERLTQLRGL